MEDTRPDPEAISSNLLGFEEVLFRACLRNVEDFDNPLRFNNFAYSFRELLRHVLHRLAPTEKLKRCVWFEPDLNARDGVTRRHRVYFAVQGGLSDVYVNDILGIDISDTHKALASAVDDLNKHTHVDESTFGMPPDVVETKVGVVIEAFRNLFRTMDALRTEVILKFEATVDDAAVNAALYETIQAIDELSTHHWIEEIIVDEVEVVSIDDASIHLRAHGTVSVELQFGSNSDVKNDMGAILPKDFPFECDLTAPVNDPDQIEPDDDGFRVDTSSWRAYDDDG